LEPIGVVIPKSEQDIIETVRIAGKYKAPLLSRGGGTSLAGQCTNVVLVMDMSKYYHGVKEVNAEKKLATVLPGTIPDDINLTTGKQGLIFGPDPATHNHNCIGGMIGNNSCGIHSVLSSKYGYGARMSDNLHSMKIITYDGEIMTVGPTSDEELKTIIEQGGRKGQIYSQLKALRDEYADEIRERFPKIPRRVSGYNLDELLPEKGFNVARALAGTEGTCMTILEATIMLLPEPKTRGLIIIGYPDVFSAGDHVPDIMKLGPIGLEGMDLELVHFMEKRGLQTKYIPDLPKGKGWLFAEFGGDNKKEVDEKLNKVKEFLKGKKDDSEIRAVDYIEEEMHLWKLRESGLGATAFVKGMPDSWPGWEDSAVAPEKVGDYLRDLRALFSKYNYHPSLYGHFGQGCIHCRVDFDLVTEEGLEHFHSFLEEATSLVSAYGGSYSGEHGDGQSRAEFLGKMFGAQIVEAFAKFKRIWDPENKMNPGRIVDPDAVLTNLRLGTEYNPIHEKTYYQYPDDEYQFSRAVLRCVGVGECRKEWNGTMCPSYMVTHEDSWSTRGRAHLLFEMTRGSFPGKGWKIDSIKEALHYCLSCKGCKGECPVNVDMATYKSEFMAHYYHGKIRPLKHLVFGHIKTFANLGSKFPHFSNWLLSAPVIGSFFKGLAGIAKEREMPKLADVNFKKWFFSQKQTNSGSKKVIFWADTFNNYFHVEVAKAAARVLQDAGWQLIVTRKNLCCGRPLYDFGMISTAKKWLMQIIDEFREEIRQGTPLVGLEPSCVATFKEEIISLFPHDQDVMRLSCQTYMFSDFMVEKNPEYKLPEILKKAVVHVHCHHKSVLGINAEKELLSKLKLDFKILDSGCCGMAGPFGFEKEKYDLSVKVADRVLLPAIRESDDQLIIADGFSCKEQIRQLSHKQALHIAEVIADSLKLSK
jgi:FAD/FMN-containing dehydrogenase/Fe-S oxidoreductase